MAERAGRDGILTRLRNIGEHCAVTNAACTVVLRVSGGLFLELADLHDRVVHGLGASPVGLGLTREGTLSSMADSFNSLPCTESSAKRSQLVRTTGVNNEEEDVRQAA